jgi:hypothetical protein
MAVNNIQIGGTHYQKEYQHWDLVIDTDMPYLLGCATKYVTRWQDKNGVEDLKKSIHYIEKAKERGVIMSHHDQVHVKHFAKQLQAREADVILKITSNYFDVAILLINDMIASVEEGATPEYVAQEAFIRG